MSSHECLGLNVRLAGWVGVFRNKPFLIVSSMRIDHVI